MPTSALPRPVSVFDAVHPTVDTSGIVTAEPEGFYNILGIAIPNGRKYQVMMRGSEDKDADAVVDAASELSRQMTKWLKDNTPIVIERGTIYGHGDVPLGDRIPAFGPIEAGTVVVEGTLQEQRNTRARQQGEPLFIYRKRIFVRGRGECKPVVMGRGWS